jgi:hypothetical protein
MIATELRPKHTHLTRLRWRPHQCCSRSRPPIANAAKATSPTDVACWRENVCSAAVYRVPPQHSRREHEHWLCYRWPHQRWCLASDGTCFLGQVSANATSAPAGASSFVARVLTSPKLTRPVSSLPGIDASILLSKHAAERNGSDAVVRGGGGGRWQCARDASPAPCVARGPLRWRPQNGGAMAVHAPVIVAVGAVAAAAALDASSRPPLLAIHTPCESFLNAGLHLGGHSILR